MKSCKYQNYLIIKNPIFQNFPIEPSYSKFANFDQSNHIWV